MGTFLRLMTLYLKSNGALLNTYRQEYRISRNKTSGNTLLVLPPCGLIV